MATRSEAGERPRRAGSNVVLGWLVAAVVVAAAVIAIVFVNGANHRAEEAGRQVSALQTQLRGAQARANLSSLRANLLAGADRQTLQQQFERVRSGLQDTYQGAGATARSTWNDLAPRLDELGRQIDADRQQAAATAQQILDGLPAQP